MRLETRETTWLSAKTKWREPSASSRSGSGGRKQGRRASRRNEVTTVIYHRADFEYNGLMKPSVKLTSLNMSVDELNEFDAEKETSEPHHKY